MKAILVTEPMRFELTAVAQPKCNASEVLIRTAYCGICGTDLEILRGTMPRGYVRYPLVPGHEWTGTIVQTGEGVSHCTVGDRVSVEGYLSCGACPHCRAGETNLCDGRKQIGFTQNGGFAEYVVAPARSCHPLQEHISLEEALLVEPAATIVRGIRGISPIPGFDAVVVGCGPIGQITIRMLSLYQPSNVLGIDRSELQRSLAIQAGATMFTSTLDASELVRKSGGEGWDVVVNCAGGSKAFDLCLEIVRRGGCVVVIGGSPDEERLSVPANLILMKDLHVSGVCGYTTQSWLQTLDLLATRALRLGDLITHRYRLEEFHQAVALLQSRKEPLGKVVISCA